MGDLVGDPPTRQGPQSPLPSPIQKPRLSPEDGRTVTWDLGTNLVARDWQSERSSEAKIRPKLVGRMKASQLPSGAGRRITPTTCVRLLVLPGCVPANRRKVRHLMVHRCLVDRAFVDVTTQQKRILGGSGATPKRNAARNQEVLMSPCTRVH